MGPLELRPYQGSGWYPKRQPKRLRATYKRLQGVEQFLGFYDVHADCLVGQVRKRKTHRDLLAVFARLRTCYPKERRIYLVMDNLNTHRHPLVRAFYESNNIEAVWTPTYSSWLNAIEAHFGGIRKFAIDGADDPSHDCRRRRIQRYLTWRNKHHGVNGCPLTKFRYNKLDGH
jgi:transposase